MEALKKAGEYVNVEVVTTTALTIVKIGFVKFLGTFLYSSACKIGTAAIVKGSAAATLKAVGTAVLVKLPNIVLYNTPHVWLATGAAGAIYYGGKFAYNMYISRI